MRAKPKLALISNKKYRLSNLNGKAKQEKGFSRGGGGCLNN